MLGNMIEISLQSRISEAPGFPVRRLLPHARRRTVGPFIFFDHMGPADFPAGEGVDVRPHPHIGLATVTWLFEGVLRHRDSLGFTQDIHPGDVNWMTAGSGIVHSERTPEESRDESQRLHGIQTWIALPREHEATDPAFHNHPAVSLPRIERDGCRITVIAGSAFGETSPVAVFSDTLYCEAILEPGAELAIDGAHAERAIYVVDGAVEADGEALPTGELVVFAPSADAVRLRAGSDGARLMLVGGEPVDGERFIWWNFVASTREAIDEAARRWENGDFDPVPGDDERIPLPDR